MRVFSVEPDGGFTEYEQLPFETDHAEADLEQPGKPSRWSPIERYLVAPPRNRAASGGFAANVEPPGEAGDRPPPARATGHLGNPLAHDLPDAVGAEGRGAALAAAQQPAEQRPGSMVGCRQVAPPRRAWTARCSAWSRPRTDRSCLP